MNSAGKYYIQHILESVVNGQFTQAKDQIQDRCKTKPEKQAYRLAQVVGALCDPNHPYYNVDSAVTLLKRFDR